MPAAKRERPILRERVAVAAEKLIIRQAKDRQHVSLDVELLCDVNRPGEAVSGHEGH